MALTQRLAFIIDSKVDGAVRGLKAVEKELDQLEKDAKAAGREFDRVGERNARLSGLQKAIGGLSEATGLSEQKIKTLGISAATAGAGIATAIGVKSVLAASDLNEQLSRSRVVFGDAAIEVQKFADAGAKIGLSKAAALEAAGGFGTLFTNIGKTTSEASTMSTRLVALASDLASFSNTSVADALAAIQSGLNGEQEPLRRYAVFLSDATLKQEALKDGLITTTTAALTPAQRALAAYNQILGQTTLQQGDFARTQSGFANSTRTLQANINNLEASIGEKLIPAVTALVNKLNEIHTPEGVVKAKSAVDGLVGPFDRLHGAINKINVDIPIFGKLLDPTPFLATGQTVSRTFDAFDAGKGVVEDLGRATGILTTQVNLNSEAFGKVRKKVEDAKSGLNSMLSVVQPVTGSLHLIKVAVDDATTAWKNLGDAAIAAAQAQAAGALVGVQPQPAVSQITGSAAPPIQVTRLVTDAATVQQQIDDYLRALAHASDTGVSRGLSDARSAAEELADYLQSVAEDRLRKLGNVFDALSGNLSFDAAKRNVEEAAQKVADLQQQASGNKFAIAQQQSLVGQLLEQSLTITPEEQLRIEQAQKDYEDTLARFQGLATQTVNAPASSFLGPTTINIAGPKASLAELQVAENNLAKAKADAVGPTQELLDAQKKLDDLRQQQKDLPKQIADAERDLLQAKYDLVDAERRQIENGQTLLDQGPEFIDWYKEIGRQAGLTAGDVNILADSLLAVQRAGATSKGLVDIGFTAANGQRFFTPEDAAQIFKFIGAQVPGFAEGGVVPGPVGKPQLAVVHGGETVLRAGQSQGGNITINVSAWDQGSIPAIARALRSEVASMVKRAS